MKKFIIVLLVAVIAATGCFALAACNKHDKIVIGVLQYAAHPSLDNCYEGFKAGLAEKGFDADKVDCVFLNAQAKDDDNTASAQTLVNSNVDLICAIATPSAIAAAKAAEGDIPVVFTAVSDPKAAGLDLENNVTGSSDRLPLAGQLELIKAFVPGVDKIGIVYSTKEQNSVSQIAELEAMEAAYGLDIIAEGIGAESEIPAAVDKLIGLGVDCLNNLTDNTVVSNLSVLLEKAALAGIPVFGSEIEQVKNGCLASQSIDYFDLGKRTGYMAAQILSGEKKAEEIEFLYIEDSVPVYNSTVLQTLGLTLPASYADAQNVAAAA